MALVGRDRELASITRFLDGERSRVLLVQGEPGIGKSSLCGLVPGLAAARDRRVLRTVGSAAETQLSFTGLRDLLDDAFTDDVAAVLPEPQRHALAVALLREEESGSERLPETLPAAVRSVLEDLGRRQRVLLLLDDVQWLDGPSAAAIRYALRRATSPRVVFVVCRRIGVVDRLGVDELPPESVTTIELGALSIGALGRIVHERLGTAYPRPTLARIHDASGGNPFFALALARRLGARSRPLRPGEPLPVRADLPELVRDQFLRLPDDCVDALSAAAAHGRPTLRLLDDVLDTDAELAIEAGVGAQLVTIEGGDVLFTHPLYAAAAYDLVTPTRRRTIHARLAECTSDTEERARHLALASRAPSEVVAAALADAARRAAERGAASAAAELAEESVRLTPRTEAGEHAARSLEAGWFQFVVGDAQRARELLDGAERTAPTGVLRARARTRLGWLEHHAGNRRGAAAQYLKALEETDDPQQRAEIFNLLAWSYAITRTDAARAAAYARRAVDLCDDGVDDPVLLADALSVLAQAEFFLGGGLPSAAMERALGLPPCDREIRVLRRPTNHWGLMLLCADRFDEARGLFEATLEEATAHGDESAVPWPLMRLAQLDLAVGAWGSALTRADDGLAAAELTGQVPVRADLTCTRALVLAHLGDVDRARHEAEAGLAMAEACGSGIGQRVAVWALGMLELVTGDPGSAAMRLAGLWNESKAAGIVDPGENRYLSDLGAALVATAELDAAAALGAELEALGRRLTRPSAIGAALRIRGLVAEAADDLETAESLLVDAVHAHRDAGVPFELARSLLRLGAVQRRARRRRDARATLDEAAAIFRGLGATVFERESSAEVARIGGRVASADGLTPTEQRVAELVAGGKSNKEAAATLVVSVHTVEAALTSIYRKLDVRSRTEMAQRLRESKH